MHYSILYAVRQRTALTKMRVAGRFVTAEERAAMMAGTLDIATLNAQAKAAKEAKKAKKAAVAAAAKRVAQAANGSATSSAVIQAAGSGGAASSQFRPTALFPSSSSSSVASSSSAASFNLHSQQSQASSSTGKAKPKPKPKPKKKKKKKATPKKRLMRPTMTPKKPKVDPITEAMAYLDDDEKVKMMAELEARKRKDNFALDSVLQS